jgi:hypothetical protein
MNLLELQLLAVVSRIPIGNEVPSVHAPEPVRASSGRRTAGLHAPPIEERVDPKRSV